jgi:dTDP-4-dehydrorhamnose reductase
MRVTIFGAAGLLGKAILREWTGDELTGVDVQDGDIRNADHVKALVEKHNPKCIVLAAAYTDVDGCESNRDLCFDVNTKGAVNVARAARDQGSRLLFLSTDYVFDGTKRTPYEADDPRCPRSVYGRSKADAEIQLSEIMPECCIVRTSWMFGVGGKSFPDTILKLAQTKPELEVVDDQRGCPTYAPDLARALMQLARANASGIVHATNSGDCSWFELARECVALAGVNTVIRPTTSDKYVRPAERPKYSVLSPKSLHAHGITMPTWHDALGRYLQERNVS